jgi:subtilase family serine protease
MGSQLRFAVVATVLLFAPCRAFAQDHFFQPQSMRVAEADAAPTAPVRPCETRFFDRSLNELGSPACYGPYAIRAAYGLNSMIEEGFTGKGQTIVILNAFGSPTALADLRAFDEAFGLPHPPSFKVITMPGTPAFDVNDPNQLQWAQETSLDIQWAHAIAPSAKIVLVAAASNSDKDLLAGLTHAIDNRLGQVISISFGQSESFLGDDAGLKMVRAWEGAFARARERGITVFAAAGDQGSTNLADEFGDILPNQNVNYPASSPNVTAVGGTNLFFGTGDHADPNGKYLGETVWNDAPQGISFAGGGGVSALFDRPQYQAALPFAARRALNGQRGIPDVSFNAGVVGGVLVYLGFLGEPQFFIMGGTSAGAAQWAGVIADLNQALGHSLGFLNGHLYRLGAIGMWEREERHIGIHGRLFHDVMSGDNSFCGTDVDWNSICVPGFSAGKGWDLATGWGTPNLGIVAALFDHARGHDDDYDDDRD